MGRSHEFSHDWRWNIPPSSRVSYHPWLPAPSNPSGSRNGNRDGGGCPNQSYNSSPFCSCASPMPRSLIALPSPFPRSRRLRRSDCEDMMRYFLLWVFVLAMTSVSFGAENPLSINVLETEKSGTSTYLLLSVENRSDQPFQSTRWSCVFLDRGDPVHEEESIVENVPPRGRAIQRKIQSYGGSFDKVECRFMSSRPSVY